MSESHFDGLRMAEDPLGKDRALYAARPFAIGEAIYRLDYWSAETMPMHVTNHSCDPNAAFDADGMLRALRSIAEGEEITFSYRATPTPASPWDFECLCGSANCVGRFRAESVRDDE